MSKPKDVTQKTFQPYLLATLGEMVDYTADQAVHFTETYAPVCKRMGITEDQYGQCETHDKPWTHRLIGLTFRTLRDKGLGDYKKKGYWFLTQMGIQKAREEAGLPALTVEEKSQDPEDPESTELVHTAARVTGLAEEQMDEADVLRLPTVHSYHNDPYIRSIAIDGTSCFGAFSGRSETCKTCPIAQECVGAVAAAKSKIAMDLEAEDAKKIADKDAKERAKTSQNETIDDLISSFDGIDEGKKSKKSKSSRKNSGKKPSKATAQREGICCRCNKSIPKGDGCYWIKGEGIMHEKCLD